MDTINLEALFSDFVTGDASEQEFYEDLEYEIYTDDCYGILKNPNTVESSLKDKLVVNIQLRDILNNNANRRNAAQGSKNTDNTTSALTYEVCASQEGKAEAITLALQQNCVKLKAAVAKLREESVAQGPQLTEREKMIRQKNAQMASILSRLILNTQQTDGLNRTHVNYLKLIDLVKSRNA